MVKTVKFLALSLLVPSLVLAWQGGQRDGLHFAAGFGTGLMRSNAYAAKGVDITQPSKQQQVATFLVMALSLQCLAKCMTSSLDLR